MTDQIAPAHIYRPELGSGIEWLPGQAKLYQFGRPIATARHDTPSPYAFWHNLAFAECFPEVTHWWLRSAWTQALRLTRLQGLMDDGAAWGWMQFVDDQTPAQMYTITESDPPVVAVPFPPNENQPLNLPLRLALARLAVGLLHDDVVPDEWLLVTSLVPRDELRDVFSTELSTIWVLEGLETMPLRQALCQLQGLKE
jgi:hypothetical protein